MRFLRGGQTIALAPFRVFYQFTNEGLRFGAVASKKNFKKATDRNRIRRLIREVYRTEKPGLKLLLEQKAKGMDLFFVYTKKEIPEYKQLLVKMQVMMKKLMDIANENNTPAA